MPRGDNSHFLSRVPLLCFWGVVCVLILLAPVCERRGRRGISAAGYLAFSGVCHQAPERSFTAAGLPWAVCQRCSGIYFGVLAALFAPVALLSRLAAPGLRRPWAILASAPLLLDVLLDSFGLLPNTPFTRFTSGLLFGTMAGTLLFAGVAELFGQAARRCVDLQGGWK